MLLGRLRDRLAELDAFAVEDCEAAVKGFVESEGIKMGEVIHALRDRKSVV